MPSSPHSTLVEHAPSVRVRDLFRRFWPDARPYRRWIAVGLVLLAVVPAIEAAGIAMFARVVDDVLVPRDLEPLPWIAGAYLGLLVLGGAASFADEVLATWVGERFLLGLRTRVFAHLQRLSLDRRRLGDVLSRLTGDVQAIEAFVLSGVQEAIGAAIRVVLFTGALFVIEWRLALASLVVVPLFAVVAGRFGRRIKRASREKRRRSGSLSAVAEESLANLALVQANTRESTELERFRREGEGILRAELAATRLRAAFGPVIDVIELLGALIVLGLGAWALAQGTLTLGELLVFLTFLSQLYGPVRELSSLSNTAFAAAAAGERVVELLDQEPLVRDAPHARALKRARGHVAFEAVTFTYPGAAEPAVRDVTVTARPGETVALVGASGAGKSTLARLLLRFHDPEAGAVRLDGHDLRDVTLSSVREQVAVLLQETLIFDGTVRENIAYGRDGATDAEVEAAARAAGAHEFIGALPDGYDTRVAQRGRALSGGQRQRLAIARALVRDAPVLLLDEPSTGLDAAATERLREPLRRLMAGRTTIVISHDLLLARDASRIVVLDEGRVVEEGTHAELVARGGHYARLHRLRETPAELRAVA